MGEEHGVHAKGSSGTDNGSHIGWIYYVFKNGNAAGIFTYFFHRRKDNALHGTEHAPCQCKSGKFCKHIVFSSKNRDIRVFFKKLSGFTCIRCKMCIRDSFENDVLG